MQRLEKNFGPDQTGRRLMAINLRCDYEDHVAQMKPTRQRLMAIAVCQCLLHAHAFQQFWWRAQAVTLIAEKTWSHLQA
jgi:hypothetical protein